MLGSVDEAEEVVQDVYLDAWRAYGAFEGRSSLRTWLYRIATRACFKALEKSRRRPLRADPGAPQTELEGGRGAPAREAPWRWPVGDCRFAPGPAVTANRR